MFEKIKNNDITNILNYCIVYCNINNEKYYLKCIGYRKYNNTK